MNETLDQVHVALTSVSQFAHLKQEDYKATRLGGLTNLVFKIETPVDCLIVRIPGKGTEEYIDRVVEAHNAKVAAEAGVSAEVIFVDPSLYRRHRDHVTRTISIPGGIGGTRRFGAQETPYFWQAVQIPFRVVRDD